MNGGTGKNCRIRRHIVTSCQFAHHAGIDDLGDLIADLVFGWMTMRFLPQLVIDIIHCLLKVNARIS